MHEFKYIVFKPGNLNIFSEEEIIFFSRTIDHIGIAKKMGLSEETIISAGHAIIMDDKVQCYGRSITLKIESRNEKDTILAKITLGL